MNIYSKGATSAAEKDLLFLLDVFYLPGPLTPHYY